MTYAYKKRIKRILGDHANGIVTKDECCYCGLNLTGSIYCSVEHIVPISKGGNESTRNLRRCCSGCNHMRANFDLKTFHSHVQHLAFNNPNDQRLKTMLSNIKWHIGYVEACELALKEK